MYKKISLLLIILFSTNILGFCKKGFITYFTPRSHNEIIDGISRSQLIQLISYGQTKLYTITEKDYMYYTKDMNEKELLDYNANSLAMDLIFENDYILTMNYISEPVVGIIYFVEDNDSQEPFYNTELIWIGEKHIFSKNYKYKIDKRFSEFISKFKFDINIDNVWFCQDGITSLPIE